MAEKLAGVFLLRAGTMSQSMCLLSRTQKSEKVTYCRVDGILRAEDDWSRQNEANKAASEKRIWQGRYRRNEH
eukprot:1597512-Amphidinium_carterae.1